MDRKEVCSACGTSFKTVYYQRRAADEPPDEVTFCEKCPLDINKLSIRDMNVTKVEHKDDDSNATNERLNGLGKDIQSYPLLEYVDRRFSIEVTGRAAQVCYTEISSRAVKRTPVIAKTVPVRSHGTIKLLTLNMTSTMKGEAHYVSSSSRIAPFVSLNEVDVYSSNTPNVVLDDCYVVSYEWIIDTIKDCSSTILRTQKDGRRPVITVYVDDNSRMAGSRCHNVLRQILNNYGTETTIKSFTHSELINSLYIQSSRAIDSAPLESGYMYSWKPDGERFWCVKYGSVWLFCRRLLSARIMGWKLTDNIETSESVGPVFDVEVLISHIPILIDILVSTDSLRTSENRCLEDVLKIYNDIKRHSIHLHVREYYNTVKELKQYKHTITYPMDGIIGVENGTVNIIKVKDVKAIELELKEDGGLATSDGIVIASSKLIDKFEVGSIMEIRFSNIDTSAKPQIVEVLLRTDKNKANDYDACKDIMSKASLVPYSLARRTALQWCNSIRRRMFSIASSYQGRGRIVLDIGSGDGQAISDYSTDSEVTYLFIEPDRSKCYKLSKRLSTPGGDKCTVYEDADQIFKAVKSLTTKSSKYIIMCSKIEEILVQKDIMKILKTSVRCCVASYSISHTYIELVKLAVNSVPLIGCGYMYDDMKSSGILVDSSGVSMKVKENTAEVKWGGDKKYTEYPIVKRDFEECFYIKRAVELIPTPSDNGKTLLHQLSSNLYLISTDRYTF